VKVKKVVIEWEEGGETQYTNQTMNEALIHELRLQLAEEKQYLAAARAESDKADNLLAELRAEMRANSDNDQDKINYWIGEHGKIKKNYDELCKQIRKLCI
jgi:peptidoglycan hydrolase CwlO-like protein